MYVRVKILFGLQNCFWTKLWVGVEPVSITFPSFFQISMCKESSVAALLSLLRDCQDFYSAITGFWRCSLQNAEQEELR